MEKQHRQHAEFRFYEKPSKEPVLALMGKEWIRYFEGASNCLHFHNMMEIGYCNWGKGQLFINKDTYDYHDGVLTLIPHNILHGTISEGLCYWEYLFFDAEELLKDYYRDEPEKAGKIIRSVTRNVRIYRRNEDPYLHGIVKMIFHLMKKKNAYYKETIKGLLFSLVMQLASRNVGEADKIKNERVSKIVSALEYIGEHYRENVRIHELAACCHLSETHFRRVFQEDMGMTPVEYINLVRVQMACDLMRKVENNMEEVAVKVGYQTMSTFNRNFHKIIGMSPYQWKKQMDKELEKIENYHISAKRGW